MTNNGHASIETLGWLIVGCGWVTRDYGAPAIQAAPNACLVALCDRRPDALEAAAPRADVLRTTDLDEALRHPAVAAVYVATPNDAHRPIVEAAAAAGKAVLCEKPMARTTAEAEAMLTAVRSAGVPYATAFDQRFHPAHQALRRLIAEGALGTVTAVHIRYACWTPADWRPDALYTDNWRVDAVRAGGGAFIDLAPHGLDLTQVLLGDALDAVIALTQQRVFSYGVDDGAVLVGRTAAGALLSLSVAYNCPDAFPRRRLEVVGTEARALALDTMGQTPGGTLVLTDRQGRERPVPFDAGASPFTRQVEAFSQAVLDGRPLPFTPEHDLHTMRLLDAAVGQLQAVP